MAKKNETKGEQSMKLIQVERKTRDIHGKDGTLWKMLHKAAPPEDGSDPQDRTNQGVAVGEKMHLIDKMVARELRDFNTTHSACLDAKTSSTVGLGHRDESIHETLDPLCQFSWQDTLDALADDFWETGECFLEVVKGNDKDPDEITGLFHLESAQVTVEVEEEDNSENFHYVVRGETGGSETTIMAKWGDLARLKETFGDGAKPRDTSRNANKAPRRSALGGRPVNSEVIHIRQGRNRSRFYGFPDYMSAVPSIELVQCMTQHEFDFYFNRGVPEFLLFLIGRNINPDTWTKVEKMIQASQGLGNSHKTGGVQIPGTPEETKVQVEKLAMEDSGNNGFSDKSLTLAMLIATAHGVPPMLANILLPGKIGAANEGPNALMIFQKRKLGQAQRNFSTMFARTLGSKGVKFAQPEGKPKSLTADAFLGKTGKPKANPMDPMSAMGTTDENGMPIFAQPGNGFKTVLDGMTLGAQDTLARMKEPLATSDRNPEDGLLGSSSDRKPAAKPKPKKPAA